MDTLKPKINTILDMRIGVSSSVKRIRGYKLTQIRKRIFLRDGYCCRGCGRESIWELKVDHIKPLHLGGKESDDNRQLLCKDCHDAKTSKEEMNRN